MITLSGLQLVAACPGSASLPRLARANAAASLGNAIHEMIARRVGGYNEGSTFDVARLTYAHGLSPDDAGRLAFLAEHLRLPVPRGALAEVALGYFPDRSARRIEGGAGDYPDVGQWLSGTLDAMWAEPAPLTEHWCGHLADPGSTLWIVDWKTGDEEHVPPIARNWQLRAGAVMAARWTGATRVIPAICYVNAAECAAWLREHPVEPYEGRWEVGAPLDAAALDAIETEMRAVLARARSGDGTSAGLDVERAHGSTGRESVAGQHEGRADPRGIGAPLILGPHCEHCPARGACPALAAEAVSLARAAYPYREDMAPALTPAERSYLAGIIPAMRRTLDRIEEAIRAGGPVELANGQVLEPALEQTTSFATGPTFDALAERVGDERAQAAFVATEARLKDVLRGDAARLPRGAWEAFKADVEARGGVVHGAREVWRKRWPAEPAEVADATTEGDHAEPGGHRGGEVCERDETMLPEGAGPLRLADGLGAGSVETSEAGRVVSGSRPVPDTVLTRAVCAVCRRGYALTSKRVLRMHAAIDSALRCKGSGEPPLP